MSYKANQKGRESVAQEGTPPKVVFRLVLIKIILFDALQLDKNNNNALQFLNGNVDFPNVDDVINRINNYFNNANSTTNRELLKTLYAESREEGVSNTDAMINLHRYNTTFFSSRKSRY